MSATAEAMNLAKIPEFAELFRSFAQMNNEREATAAKADPVANKLTRVFDPGISPNYRYYTAGVNGKSQRIVFCWSTHRNAAGFYLGWRETYRKNGDVKRDMWLARRVRSRCKDIALSRSTKARTKGQP